jgi:hypothetical protein
LECHPGVLVLTVWPIIHGGFTHDHRLCSFDDAMFLSRTNWAVSSLNSALNVFLVFDLMCSPEVIYEVIISPLLRWPK